MHTLALDVSLSVSRLFLFTSVHTSVPRILCVPSNSRVLTFSISTGVGFERNQVEEEELPRRKLESACWSSASSLALFSRL